MPLADATARPFERPVHIVMARDTHVAKGQEGGGATGTGRGRYELLPKRRVTGLLIIKESMY